IRIAKAAPRAGISGAAIALTPSRSDAGMSARSASLLRTATSAASARHPSTRVGSDCEVSHTIAPERYCSVGPGFFIRGGRCEPARARQGAGVQSLIPTVIGLGLAVALCSPVSVVTVIVLLTMPSGRRRGIAFVLGWLLAIGVIGVVVVGVAHGQDFSSHQTTSSRAASWVEIAVGLIAVLAAS